MESRLGNRIQSGRNLVKKQDMRVPQDGTVWCEGGKKGEERRSEGGMSGMRVELKK
jgi:hypothetical protein